LVLDHKQGDGSPGMSTVTTRFYVFDDKGDQPKSVESALGPDLALIVGPYVKTDHLPPYDDAKSICYEAAVDIVGNDQDDIRAGACVDRSVVR
jgi:hypothetical protein